MAALLVVPALLYTLIIGWRLELRSDTESRVNTPTRIEQGQNRSDESGATDGGGTGDAASSTAGAPGAITARAEFTSVFAKDEEYLASETVTWDDAWFFADSATYNHELAQACCALSSVANAESEHFMMFRETPDYMLDFLSELGFEYAITNTYEHRSAIVDQLAEAIRPAGGDVTAYTIASKHITDASTGKSKLLVIAVMRGTYGPEWFSNLRAGVAEGKASQENSDHAGFSAASEGFLNDLYDYVAWLRENGDVKGDDQADVSLLLCGHSRGGAVADLAAAFFDDYPDGKTGDVEGDEDDAFESIDAVYAYTFATPGTTRNSECRASRYDNIFNICNPADLIPQTPLASWGYGRYGHDLWLPEEGSGGFDALFEDVRRRVREIEGCDTGADPADAAVVKKLIQDIGAAVPTIDDFSTPSGVFGALEAVSSGADLGRILQSHSPELYFCWLQAIEASQLTATE